MGPIAGLAMNAAETAVNSGLGMITAGFNDRRQIRQQGKLNEQQYAIDGRSLARQNAADLQMWKDTSYGAQREEMEKAGINPGLMYGMSGGGGQTTGHGGAATNAAKAPAGGNEIMGMQLMGAQKALLEAQTEKTKAETTKTAGVDTELSRQQGRMAHIAADLHAMTNEEAAEQMQARTHILWQEAKAAQGMVTAELRTKQAEAIGAVLMNDLREAQKDLTVEQMGAIGEQIAQKWKALEIEQGKLDLQKFVQDVSNSTKLTVETITKAVEMVGGGLIQKGLKQMPNKSEHTKKIEW